MYCHNTDDWSYDTNINRHTVWLLWCHSLLLTDIKYWISGGVIDFISPEKVYLRDHPMCRTDLQIQTTFVFLLTHPPTQKPNIHKKGDPLIRLLLIRKNGPYEDKLQSPVLFLVPHFCWLGLDGWKIIWYKLIMLVNLVYWAWYMRSFMKIHKYEKEALPFILSENW